MLTDGFTIKRQSNFFIFGLATSLHFMLTLSVLRGILEVDFLHVSLQEAVKDEADPPGANF